MISLIYDIYKKDNEVFVKAIVEDAVLVYPATNSDPEEYGPALCEATFELEENEILPSDDDQLIDYLESLNLDWEVVPKDEYEYDTEY